MRRTTSAVCGRRQVTLPFTQAMEKSPWRVNDERVSALSDPTFRPLAPGDAEAVLEVLDAAFERGWPNIPLSASPLEHLQWKIECPQPVPASSSVAEVDGRIIGYSGVVARDAWVRGRRMPGRSGGDSAIHPDFQGQGILRLRRAWNRARRDPGFEEAAIGEGTTHPRLLRSQRRRGERAFVANKAERHSSRPVTRRHPCWGCRLRGRGSMEAGWGATPLTPSRVGPPVGVQVARTGVDGSGVGWGPEDSESILTRRTRPVRPSRKMERWASLDPLRSSYWQLGG